MLLLGVLRPSPSIHTSSYRQTNETNLKDDCLRRNIPIDSGTPSVATFYHSSIPSVRTLGRPASSLNFSIYGVRTKPRSSFFSQITASGCHNNATDHHVNIIFTSLIAGHGSFSRCIYAERSYKCNPTRQRPGKQHVYVG